MRVALESVERVAAVLEERGDSKAAALVVEFVKFSRLEAEYGLNLPKDKNSHRKKSCTGKNRLDKAQAIQQAMDSNRGLPSWMRRSGAYPCLYCGHWHVGTNNPKDHRYATDEPMTDVSQWYERVWLEVQRPLWMVDDHQRRMGTLGGLLMLLAGEFGWEIPEQPGRAQKLIDRFKSEFVDKGEEDVQEDVA